MKKLLFNLQLFASPENGGFAAYLNQVALDPTQMVTTANAGTAYVDASNNPVTGILGQLSTQMKMVYSQYLIKDVGPNLIHAQFLEEEKLPANHGRIIEWRKWEDYPKRTEPIVEGVTPEPSKISSNHIHAVLSQYANWTPLTDLVQLQTIDNTLVEITEKLSDNAKRTLDTITREKMIEGCTNFAFAGGVDTIEKLSGAMTPKDVARMRIYLENKNAPTFDGDYVCIIHPTVSFDMITNDNQFIDVVKYNDPSRIFKGEIGKLYGVRFVKSTESKIVKAKKLGKGTAAAPAVTISEIAKTDSTPTGITLPSNTLDTTATGEVKANDKLWIQHAEDGAVEEVTVSSVSGQTITLSAMPSGFTTAPGDTVYLPGSAAGGKDYFICMFLGKGAGKRVAIGSENAEMIINPIGSSGSADPVKQRGSVAWKVNAYTAAITQPSYIWKYYCTSEITGVDGND